MPDLASVLSQNMFVAPLSSDEALSASTSLGSIVEIIKTSISQNNAPLWNLCQWLAFKAFGADELVTRGLSFAFFVIAIVFTFLITSHLWSKKTAIWASLLTFFNPLFFAFSFEGLAYSSLVAGVTGSMFFFVQGNLIGYILMTVWALYSHHLALLLLCTQGLWFIYTIIRGRYARSKRMLKGFIVVGLIYLPWIYPLYLKASKFSDSYWLQSPQVDRLYNPLYDYITRGTASPSMNLPFTSYQLFDLGFVLVIAILITRKWHKNLQSSIFMLLWFICPTIIAWIVAHYYHWFNFDSYLFYTIPAAMIILTSNRRKYSVILLVLLLTIYGAIDFQYFSSPNKWIKSEFVNSNNIQSESVVSQVQ